MFQKLSEAFSMSGNLNRFLNRLTDLIRLNLLCFLCCIPIVTAGASISALDSVLERYLNHEEYSVGKDFFDSFRKNFKRATIIWILSMVLYAAVALDMWVCARLNFSGRFVLMGVAVCMIVMVAFVDQYGMILVGRTELKTRLLIKNAFMISIIGLPFSLILLLLHLIPFVIMWYSFLVLFRLLFIWILFGLSVVQLAAVAFFRQVLKKLNDNDTRS